MLSQEQIKQLDDLNKRIAGGYQASATDQANLDFAKSKGYTYNPQLPSVGTFRPQVPTASVGTFRPQVPTASVGTFRPQVPTEVTTNQTVPTIPPPQEAPTVDSMMKGILTTNEGLKSIIEAQQAPLQSQPKADAIQSQIQQATIDQQTAGRDLQEQKLEQYGAGANLAELQKIMPQIAKIQADYASIEEQNRNRPISSRIIGGTADKLQRQKAIELAGLSAVAQAYQGNVDMARIMANDAVNVQFQDIENYNNNLKTQLETIYKDLSREDKVRADQLNLVIAERERQIETEKNNALGIQSLALDIAQAGADSATVSSILKAKDINEAMLLASGATYISNPAQLIGLKESDLIRVGDRIYKKGTKNWLQVMTADTQDWTTISDSAGNLIKFNKKTGETKPLAAINEDFSNATVDDIANAIKQIESNNDYTRKGASGEFGAYQFMPATWNSWSQEYARNVLQKSMKLEQTPENQDAVAKFKIGQWLAQGLSPEQIASKWNSGDANAYLRNHMGTNAQGVAYDTVNHVEKFKKALASQLGGRMGGAFTSLEAASIVTKISPRLSGNKELISEVTNLLSQGVSRDNIEDQLRYLSQSDIFEPWRNVANTAFSSVKMTNQQRQQNLDVIDDYIATGDNAGAVEHIKSTILGNIGATEKKNVTGRDDALTSIYEIERLLDEFTSLGGNTGLLTGKIENFNKVVLKKTGNEQLAYIANEVAMAIQKYRQDLTGAAFTESEAKEYNNLFPSIGKSPTLNRALINSLKSQYERNQKKFWERQLGGVANYNKLENLGGIPIVGVGDLSRFQSPNKANIITNNYLTNLGY